MSGYCLPQNTDGLVIGVKEELELLETGLSLEQSSSGYLSETLRLSGFVGKANETRILYGVNGIARVACVGLGRPTEKTSPQDLKDIARNAVLLRFYLQVVSCNLISAC